MIEGMEYTSLVDICRDADLLAILVPHDDTIAELESNRAAIESVMRTPIIERFQ
jgi:hypothetical protein